MYMYTCTSSILYPSHVQVMNFGPLRDTASADCYASETVGTSGLKNWVLCSGVEIGRWVGVCPIQRPTTFVI